MSPGRRGDLTTTDPGRRLAKPDGNLGLLASFHHHKRRNDNSNRCALQRPSLVAIVVCLCSSSVCRSFPCQSAHSLPHPGFPGTLLCFPCSPSMAFTSVAPPLRAQRVPARRGAAAATCTAPPAGPPVSRRTALAVAAAGLLAAGLGGPALPVAAYSSRTQNDMSNASPTRYVTARQLVKARMGWRQCSRGQLRLPVSMVARRGGAGGMGQD